MATGDFPQAPPVQIVGEHLTNQESSLDLFSELLDRIDNYLDVQLRDQDGNLVQYPAAGHVFDVAVTPTVTNGAYSAGDIMGALMTFSGVAPANDSGFIVTGAQVSIKAAVMPNPLTLILFNADPTNTTKTDNSAYSLNAADAFKVIATIPFQTLGVAHFDHGTPNTIRIDNLFIAALPVSGTDDIYALLIDGTGVTLTSTSDVQVRLRGIGG